MDDIGNFVFGAFFLFIVFLVFAGLYSIGNKEAISPGLIYKAEEICTNNQGLKYLEYDDEFSPHDVYCNDGAVFMDSVRKSDK